MERRWSCWTLFHVSLLLCSASATATAASVEAHEPLPMRFVLDIGPTLTRIRPMPASREGVHEKDLGAVFGFSYRLSRVAHVGLSIGFEGNDTTGVNDLLIMPLAPSVGVTSSPTWVGKSLGLSFDAAVGWELVVASRSDNPGAPCIGCYYEDVDLSSGAFAEAGVRAYFGKGKGITPGIGVRYRVYRRSADFAHRIAIVFSVGVDK